MVSKKGNFCDGEQDKEFLGWYRQDMEFMIWWKRRKD
jgi:hypothetical protein